MEFLTLAIGRPDAPGWRLDPSRAGHGSAIVRKLDNRRLDCSLWDVGEARGSSSDLVLPLARKMVLGTMLGSANSQSVGRTNA